MASQVADRGMRSVDSTLPRVLTLPSYPCPRFLGARPGYCFTTRDGILGYHSLGAAVGRQPDLPRGASPIDAAPEDLWHGHRHLELGTVDAPRPLSLCAALAWAAPALSSGAAPPDAPPPPRTTSPRNRRARLPDGRRRRPRRHQAPPPGIAAVPRHVRLDDDALRDDDNTLCYTRRWAHGKQHARPLTT